MVRIGHVDGVAVREKLDRRVGNIERRRASTELDLAFSFEAAEGRWTAWAQASTKLLKSRSKTIRIDGSLARRHGVKGPSKTSRHRDETDRRAVVFRADPFDNCGLEAGYMTILLWARAA